MEIDMADWRRQKIGNLTRAINSHKAKIARLRERLKIFEQERAELKGELKRRPIAEQKKKVFALAKIKPANEIAEEMHLTVGTVKQYIWLALWRKAKESLLHKGRATVQPNEYGGENWEYNYDELAQEMLEINASLVAKLSHRMVALKTNTQPKSPDRSPENGNSLATSKEQP